MKKIRILAIFVLLVFIFPLSAKSKKSKKQENESAESDSIQVISDSSSENVENLSLENEEVDFENLDMHYFKNWEKVKNKKIDKTFGIINIRVIPKKGTFNIGVENEDKKIIPVLSNRNEYTSSYFSLKCGNKIYKLNSGADVVTKARETENSVQIIYSVKNVADVLLEFIPVESVANYGFDMLKICVTVTNTGKKSSEFALKNVMDTVLGEADLYHFYTSNDVPIKNEVVFRTMQNEKFINSKNSAAWCQFLLDGADITPIDFVSLLNYADAQSSAWFPEISSSKTFDSVTAYNNSAIQIIWPSKKLLKDENSSFIYYLSFASDGNRPNGDSYIQGKVVPQKSKESKEDAISIIEKIKEEPKIETNPITVPEAKNDEKEKSEISKGKVAPPTIPKELLTPDYIQNLLDRIDALEADDPTLNKDELEMLNEEIDFILSVLRN